MPFAIFVDKHIQKLEALIDSDFEIARIDVRPDLGAVPLDCYGNVLDKVNREGGKIQYGWYLVDSEILCEAIHHAVWESPKGDLICITPPTKSIKKLLFIPDDRIVFDGRIVDNIRINKTQNSIVDDFIQVAEMDSIILSAGNRVSKIKVTGDAHLKQLYNKYKDLGKQLLIHVMSGKGPDHPCFCKSDKKYKACHGNGFKEMVSSDKSSLKPNIVILGKH